jgi:hypothetical protein
MLFYGIMEVLSSGTEVGAEMRANFRFANIWDDTQRSLVRFLLVFSNIFIAAVLQPVVSPDFPSPRARGRGASGDRDQNSH